MSSQYPLRSSRIDTSRVVFGLVLVALGFAWWISAMRGQVLLVTAFATFTSVATLVLILQFASAIPVWRRIAEVRRALPDHEIVASWPLNLGSQFAAAASPGSIELTIAAIGPSHVVLWRRGTPVHRLERPALEATIASGSAGLTIELTSGASTALLFPLALSYGMFVPCRPTASAQLNELFGPAEPPRAGM